MDYEFGPLTAEERAMLKRRESPDKWLIGRLLADLEAAERAILSVPEWSTLLTAGIHTCVFCGALHDEGHRPGCAWVAAKERQT